MRYACLSYYDVDAYEARSEGGRSTDGPLAERCEVIVSFFIVEAADLEEAGRVAARHPAARRGEPGGTAIEVGPLDGRRGMVARRRAER